MTKTPRIAILGCGRMGKQHASSCQRLDADVRILCDPDVERARQLAGSFPDATVAETAEAIDWPAVDAAFFCIPPFARGPAECAAAAAGVALFLEKPIALSFEAARQMRDAVKKADVITSVGYMNRYRRSVGRARQLADELGLLGVTCHWTAGFYRVPWWGLRELSGGQINEQCTHFVDLIRYFLGEITEVVAMAQVEAPVEQSDIDVAAAAILRAASGSLATLYASCGAQTKEIGFYIFTPSQQISLDNWNLELRDCDEGADETDPFETEVAAFLEAVRIGDRGPILSDLGDALRTQQVIDALVRSLDSRHWESVPRPDAAS